MTEMGPRRTTSGRKDDCFSPELASLIRERPLPQPSATATLAILAAAREAAEARSASAGQGALRRSVTWTSAVVASIIAGLCLWFAFADRSSPAPPGARPGPTPLATGAASVDPAASDDRVRQIDMDEVDQRLMGAWRRIASARSADRALAVPLRTVMLKRRLDDLLHAARQLRHSVLLENTDDVRLPGSRAAPKSQKSPWQPIREV